jgi:hypothetical protein
MRLLRRQEKKAIPARYRLMASLNAINASRITTRVSYYARFCFISILPLSGFGKFYQFASFIGFSILSRFQLECYRREFRQ